MKIIYFLLSLCLLVPQFQPFTLVSIKLKNMNTPKVEEEQTTEVVDTTPVVEQVQDTEPKVRLNNTLDLDGYCTIMIPSAYYEIIKDQSTFTRKVVRYIDNKSKLTMSYITNITRDTDVPGYIVRELAGVDTVTNDKYETTYGEKQLTWMVVPAEDEIDGKVVTVYYTVSTDGKTAFWLKSEVVPESNDEEYQLVLDTILGSYNMYYSGESVFDTPNTGYYAENHVDGDGTIGDTSDYKANTQDHNVYQADTGFVKDADISYSWKDLQIIVDGHKLQLPNKTQDFYDAGFKLNDKEVKSGDINVFPGGDVTFAMQNRNGTIVKVTVLNDSNVSSKTIDECNVVKLSIDTSDFLTITDPTEFDKLGTEESNSDNENTDSENTDTEKSEESTEENSEDKPEDGTEDDTEKVDDSKTEKEDSSESKETKEETKTETTEKDKDSSDTESTEEKEDKKTETKNDTSTKDETTSTVSIDLDKHSIILAGGVTLDIYTEDLIKYFGTNCEQSPMGSEKLIKWSDDTISMTIKAGVVQGIKYIELSTINK